MQAKDSSSANKTKLRLYQFQARASSLNAGVRVLSENIRTLRIERQGLEKHRNPGVEDLALERTISDLDAQIQAHEREKKQLQPEYTSALHIRDSLEKLVEQHAAEERQQMAKQKSKDPSGTVSIKGVVHWDGTNTQSLSATRI